MDRDTSLDELYADPNNAAARQKFMDLPFDPVMWLKWFQQYNSSSSPLKLGALRKLIMVGTWKACRTGYFISPLGEKIILDQKQIQQNVEATVMYADNHEWGQFLPRYESTLVTVVKGDCLCAAVDLRKQGLNPVCLNMANQASPGGGYKGGASSQEENLFRRSNYFQFLDPDPGAPVQNTRTWKYPIVEAACIYSPGVTVFRGSEMDGYPFLDAAYSIGMIASAAYCGPELVGPNKIAPIMELGTKKKIKALLRAGLHNGHDSIVLGAFGCGAFKNPPRHMAEIFKEEISEIPGGYKQIIFAIYDDEFANKHVGNFAPFEDVFGQECTFTRK